MYWLSFLAIILVTYCLKYSDLTDLTSIKSLGIYLNTSFVFTSMLRFFGRLKNKSSKFQNYPFGIDLQNLESCSMTLNNTASFLVFMCCFLSGVLHTSVVLLTEMCERSPDMLAHFRKVGAILCA